MTLTNPRRNEIYFVEISYSNPEQAKKRPVIILSTNSYNANEPDVVVCGITTNLGHPWVLAVEDSDLEAGKLFEKSGVRVDMLCRVDKETIGIKAGRITEQFHKKLINRILELIG